MSSETFQRSAMLSGFLKLIVEAELRGDPENLSEYAIATQVYRRPDSFDPAVDSIVRGEARRLRAKLDDYYLQHPPSAVRISVPKGGYAPHFEILEQAPPERSLTRALSRFIMAGFALCTVVALIFVIQKNLSSSSASASTPTISLSVAEPNEAGQGSEAVATRLQHQIAKGLLDHGGFAVIAVEDRAVEPDDKSIATDFRLQGKLERDTTDGRFFLSLNLVKPGGGAPLWSASLDGSEHELLEQLEATEVMLVARLAGDELRLNH